MDLLDRSPVIRLDKADNIVLALRDIPAGTYLSDEDVTTRSPIAQGHKIATRAIAKDEPVLKCNTVIGYATRDVEPGTWMHNDTIYFSAVNENVEFCRDYHPIRLVPPESRRTFLGYIREDGSVGTRNCIAVIACSNCAATVVRRIAAHFEGEALAAYPNVDAVVPLVTSTGCGIEKSGAPLEYMQRVLGGAARNPNIAGVILCALGCENNNIDALLRSMDVQPGPMLQRLVIQESGGSRKTVEAGICMIEQMLLQANRYHRQEVPASFLKVALECGGSDAFSGVSANPALGIAMDLLVQQGGTAILTEPTEFVGFEGALARRARSPEVAQQVLDMMDWWRGYLKGTDSQINGKVTPGNNAGGITNVLEKALGSTRKAGSSPLNAVIGYAKPIRESGFVIMDAPSYDPVSAAAMFAGGANLCAFTTGRGSCYGSRHMPTLKISSNTYRYQVQGDDIDLNAGAVIDGEKTLEQMGREIFETILAVASGQPTKSECFGMGGDEFVVWDIGTTA